MAAEVFTYMGESSIVPNNVVRVRVHPSVTEIPHRAFAERNNLEEVELCDGLLEIGNEAFKDCKSLKQINFPSTLEIIGDNAFYGCKSLDGVELGNGIERIGLSAFSRLGCKSSHLRIPPLVTTMNFFSAWRSWLRDCDILAYTNFTPSELSQKWFKVQISTCVHILQMM